MPLFHFMWVILLMCRKSHRSIVPELFHQQTLISVLKMVRDSPLVKRSQALLGSNLARDNQMQIALNNAAEGSGLQAAPLSIHLIGGALYYSSFSAMP